MKTALIILSEGFEEIEALTPVDILRRGDIQCTVAAHHDNKFVTGKTGIQVVADELFRDASEREYDLLVIPGGPGIRHLRKDPGVLEYVKRHAGADRLVGAICAGPTLLNDAGLLDDKRYTAHFSVTDELPDIIADQAVVQDLNIVTSRGAGTALEFGLYLLEVLRDKESSSAVRKAICA